MKRAHVLIGCLVVMVALGTVQGARHAARSEAAAAAAPAPAATHQVTWDSHSLLIDGKRQFIWSGEFHYWRLPSPALWRDVLEKMHAAGFTATSIYFDWGFHSPKPGVYDFTGVRDVERLLQIAEEVGIYVIARPGPYINAETDSGGFPGWLEPQLGVARTSAPDYTAAYHEWFDHILPILARHQITRGGNIVLVQVENEYTFGRDAAYMQDIENYMRAAGIDVPLFHNDAVASGSWAKGPGAVDMYAFDSYPQGFNCSTPEKWAALPTYFETVSRTADSTDPPFTAEFQGGSFDPWAGPGYPKCYQLTNPQFVKVFHKGLLSQGITLLNSYMGYGGTSWGWLPIPANYTSYDYGAAIDEQRQLTGKYDEMKRIGYFLQAVDPFRKTDKVTSVTGSNGTLDYTTRQNPDTHTDFVFLRHTDATSTTNETTAISLTTQDGSYQRVPQQPGTSIRINGRDSKILVAGYTFGFQRLVYSTSEILTQLSIDNRDIAVLYGRSGEDGETVLRYATAPHVTVLAGNVTATYDAQRKDLRLNYQHNGLARVLIEGGTRPLLLLLGTDEQAARFWRFDTSAGPILAHGPYLVRSAAFSAGQLVLRGDTVAPSDLELFAPAAVTSVSWNGGGLTTTPTTSQSLTGTLPGPPAVTLPPLNQWRFQNEAPERAPAFNDSAWTPADHLTTNNPNPPYTVPVLYMDDYGYHFGDVWFRGHFTATGSETGIELDGETGANGVFSVWLNGTYLGVANKGDTTFTFPANALKMGQDNVVAVLLENMGHEEDFIPTDMHKAPRGLRRALLQGVTTATLTWRIQGAQGGESLADPVRGPYNNGGLFGERNGWSVPGFNDATWSNVALPHRWPANGIAPGVGWYRTSFDLNLPANVDVPLGIRITDDKSHMYRVLIFVNGWQMGHYINNLGPQSSFPIPEGILNHHGHNEVALAVWSVDATTGGLGTVTLEAYGAYSQAPSIPGVQIATPTPTVGGTPTTTATAGATTTATTQPSPTTTGGPIERRVYLPIITR